MDKVEYRLERLINKMSEMILHLLSSLDINKFQKDRGTAIDLLIFNLLMIL